MNNLILLGNGFDLAHGMKTGYTHFIRHLVKCCIDKRDYNKNLLSVNQEVKSVEELFSLAREKGESPYSSCWLIHYLIQDITLKNWCDIEHKYYSLLSTLENKNRKGGYRDVKVLNQHFELIKIELEKYLLNQEVPNRMENYEHFFDSLCNKDSLIINFNYTKTLELYRNEINSTPVIHIHGELANAANPIIFGYAADDDETLNLSDKGDVEYLKNIKRQAYLRKDNRKRVNQYLDNHKEILVHIIGHSCGISDKLILEHILNHKNIFSIQLFYYKDYSHFHETHCNIYRIVRNNEAYDKILTFQDSTRVPQYNDSDEKTKAFVNFVNGIIEDWNRKEQEQKRKLQSIASMLP